VLAGRKGIIPGVAAAASVVALAVAARQILGRRRTRNHEVPTGALTPLEDITGSVRYAASRQPPRRPACSTGRAYPPAAGTAGRIAIPRDPHNTDGRLSVTPSVPHSPETHDAGPLNEQADGGKIQTFDRPVAFPILNIRSRAAAQPWRLPAVPSPSGIAADQASAGGLEVRAASLVGPGHRCMEPGLARQDAYRLGQDEQRRYLIVAVADGMTDSRHSDVAANIAVAAVVGLLRESLDAGAGLAELNVEEVFLAAARQISGVAHQRGWPDDQVRAVLAAAVIPTQPEPVGTRHAWLASLADVSIWRWLPGSWELLMGDVKDGMDGSRLEHYLPYHPQHATSRIVELQVGEIIAITTDGIADAFATLPGASKWFADRWREPRPLASFVLDVGYEESQFNDDRTAVVAWCADMWAD
jgi:hypothetical protein